MSRNTFFSIFCALAVIFAAAATGLEAQSQDPILDEDEELCYVVVGDTCWATPLVHQGALEWLHSAPSDVLPAHLLLDEIEQSSGVGAVRFEGGLPGPELSLRLDLMGYVNHTPVDPTMVPGTELGMLCEQ